MAFFQKEQEDAMKKIEMRRKKSDKKNEDEISGMSPHLDRKRYPWLSQREL